mmetsp:Transcript_105875/g.330126  ORF Transcript_105875/g.330126 Transcript_105875/m.330126 type:complete len:209 (-) Transcript_105875:82-708(-)
MESSGRTSSHPPTAPSCFLGGGGGGFLGGGGGALDRSTEKCSGLAGCCSCAAWTGAATAISGSTAPPTLSALLRFAASCTVLSIVRFWAHIAEANASCCAPLAVPELLAPAAASCAGVACGSPPKGPGPLALMAASAARSIFAISESTAFSSAFLSFSLCLELLSMASSLVWCIIPLLCFKICWMWPPCQTLQMSHHFFACETHHSVM